MHHYQGRTRTRVRIPLVVALLILTLSSAACHKNVIVPIPGQINTFDGTSYRYLMDAQAALNSVRDDAANDKIKLDDTSKSLLNNAIASYNVAQDAWHAYHSGATIDTAGLQSAISAMVRDVNNLITRIASSKVTGGGN